ncbi:hypothetical protein BCR33DRAFT_184396 [Rhizoclosmatium globosum]|uniref:Uncharacterized protein n=1 Tax=Rhizoclosmatium globosum TaxID=329046 RepID=A0A1Y2D163_9FUNG|nr:hypothetical protein BCR33DRAFT_184396 [Rhizoclosmatium globosum]|eukprot:ORY53018.1 hypothetical protein BCR33DRAFT_184396 [Rhizoclosmatium globosum]
MKDVAIACVQCGAYCTADNVSAKRFLTDIDRWVTQRRVMMGMALDEKSGVIAVAKAQQDLMTLFPSGLPNNISTLAAACTWEGVEDAMKTHLEGLKKLRALQNQVRKSTIPKMVRAYRKFLYL